MFTQFDYEDLHQLVFRDNYAGYKSAVKEIPNGDGRVDADKKYAHVALKYLTDENWATRERLVWYLKRAHAVAEQVAALIELPKEFWPDIRYGALRVLDYPPGAVSNKHLDFDLYTLMLFRDQPDRFQAEKVDAPVLVKIHTLNPQAHLGELGTEIGLGPATPHEVLASETRQRSIVYFAIPDHDSVLPAGGSGPNPRPEPIKVRDWLNERMARSRTEFKKYE
jgi:isopenicillin N synthase-like dioxygenase